jgi:hypothetical protein
MCHPVEDQNFVFVRGRRQGAGLGFTYLCRNPANRLAKQSRRTAAGLGGHLGRWNDHAAAAVRRIASQPRILFHHRHCHCERAPHRTRAPQDAPRQQCGNHLSNHELHNDAFPQRPDESRLIETDLRTSIPTYPTSTLRTKVPTYLRTSRCHSPTLALLPAIIPTANPTSASSSTGPTKSCSPARK